MCYSEFSTQTIVLWIHCYKDPRSSTYSFQTVGENIQNSEPNTLSIEKMSYADDIFKLCGLYRFKLLQSVFQVN